MYVQSRLWRVCVVFFLISVSTLTTALFKQISRTEVSSVLTRSRRGWFKTEKINDNSKIERICYQSLTHRYVKHMVVARGWGGKCQPHHVSFESCRQLLLHTAECNAAYYHNKVCHLLARETATRQVLVRATAMQDEFVNGVLLLKMVPELDTCILSNTSYTSIAQPVITAREALRLCNARRPDYNNTFDMFASLPRVNIVVSATTNWVDRNPAEFQMVREHWQCYADAHNYLFTLNMLPDMPPADFFVSRHKYVQQEQMSRAQYTLHLDADSLVLNMSRSLEPFLRSEASVVLQMRENFEVTSAIYIVRNDHRGYCFLDYWRRFHPPRTSKKTGAAIIPVPNNCNGALVAAVLHLSTPAGEVLSCLRRLQAQQLGKAEYPPGFKIHLRSGVSGSVAEMATWLANNTNNERTAVSQEEDLAVLRVEYPFISPYPEHVCLSHFSDVVYEVGTELDSSRDEHGVYVLWTQEGLWRTHEAPTNRAEWFVDRFRRCYPSSDLIGHGNKRIATDMYEVDHGASCNVSAARGGLGANRNCTWLLPVTDHRLPLLSNETELQILRRTCAFNSPQCLDPSASQLRARDVSHGVDPRLLGSVMNKCVWVKNGRSRKKEGEYTFNSECHQNIQVIARQKYRIALQQLRLY